MRHRFFKQRCAPDLGWTARLRARLKMNLERLVMHHIEKRLTRVLEPTGLVCPAPHDMKEIMADVDVVSHPEFDGEATISTLVARRARDYGLVGVACLGPFSCMATRLTQSMLEPYCRARGIPFLALEQDGTPFPTNTVAQLEVFANNARRAHERFA
jgi:hypothetical protein